jgi:hypothetical protein
MSLVEKLLAHIRGALLADVYRRLDEIGRRQERIEYHAFNRRFYAVEQIAEYLIGAQIPGDYFEFGVYKGMTFAHACKTMAPLFPKMRFVACDSFEGLPAPRGIDAVDGYSSHFYERQFECPKEQVLANLRQENVDLSRVVVVEGWYDRTLNERTRGEHGLDRVAFAWVDCDLYESTVPVLKFIAPMLSIGSVVLFDDWRCFRNLPDFGQQRAVREWLESTPGLRLSELMSFGWNGLAFAVTGLGEQRRT